MDRRDFRGVFERQATRRPAPDVSEKQSDKEPSKQPSSNFRNRKIWLAGTTGLVLFIYIVAGVVVYALGPGSGNPIHLPFLYGYLPSASLILAGKQGAYVVWLITLLLGLTGLILFVAGQFSRRWRDSDLRGALGLIGILALLWAVLTAGHWFIPYNTFSARYDSLLRYQGKQLSGQQTPDELKTQALQQVITQRYIAQEAAKYKVKVSDQDIDKAYQQSVGKAGGEGALKKQLNDYLGWSVDDYKADLKLKMQQDKLDQKLKTIYKGEADAYRKELYKSKVRSYVHGLNWHGDTHNIQPAGN